MADIEWSGMLSSAGAGATAGSAVGPWGAAAGALVGAAGNVISQLFTNKANRDLQRESWDRMSISSRVKELEKNGLNKLFAAGSMPSYNLSTSMKAPEINPGAALNAYQAAKEIQLMDINTKNALIQNKILDNEYSSSKSKAILDKINEVIAAGDYGIISDRQSNGIRSDDIRELQLLGFGEKFTGVHGATMKDLIRNSLGLGPDNEELFRLREENAALKAGYRSPDEYDQWNYDRPGFDWDSQRNLPMVEVRGQWYVIERNGKFTPVDK